MGRPLLGGEYGCYRSHLAAAAAVRDSGHPFGLVLEDDASFGPDLVEILHEAVARLERDFPGWHLLHLSSAKTPIHSALADLPGGHCLAAAHHFPLNTVGLVWSQTGAAAFCAEAARIEIPVDEELRDRLTRSGRGYTVLPAPVVPTQAPSEIGVSGSNRKKRGRVRNHWFITKRRYLGNKLIARMRKLAFATGRRHV